MARMIFVNLPVEDLERRAPSRGDRRPQRAEVHRRDRGDDGPSRHHPRHAPDHDSSMQRSPAADRGREEQQSKCCCASRATAAASRSDHRSAAAAGGNADPAPETGRWAADVRAQLRRPGRPHLGDHVDGRGGRRTRRASRRIEAMREQLSEEERKMPINPDADDRDHRVPLGPGVRPGPGPRPARPLGARRSRARLSRPPARPATGRRNISRSSRSTRCPCFSDGRSRFSRAARSSNISASKSEALAAARSAGQVSRDPMDLCRAQQRRAGDPQPAADRRLLRRRGMGEDAPPGRRWTSPS